MHVPARSPRQAGCSRQLHSPFVFLRVVVVVIDLQGVQILRLGSHVHVYIVPVPEGVGHGDKTSPLVDQSGILRQGQKVYIGITQQKVEVNAIGQHFLTVTVVMLNAKEHVEVFPLGPLPGSKIYGIIPLHLLPPGPFLWDGRIAQKKVVGKHHPGIPSLIVGPGHLIRRAHPAAAPPAGVAVGLVKIRILFVFHFYPSGKI